MAITDSNQRIIWLNPALARLSGKTNEAELQHQNIIHVLGLCPEEQCRLSQAFDNPQSTRPIKLNVMGNQTIVNAEVSSLAVPSEDHSKNPKARCHDDSDDDRLFVIALKDITEAEALKAAQHSAEQEALMAKAMKESMETLTHELRTPLQGIMGVCSMLVCDSTLNLHHEAKESLDIIMASSSLLLVLINNLLDVRKCDANMMENFELTPTLSLAPIQDSADFCRPLAKISGLTIDIETQYYHQLSRDEEQISSIMTPPPVILANALRLQQVIINLISNAIKYTPNGSRILVETKTSTLGQVRAMTQTALAVGPEKNRDDDKENEGAEDRPVLVISVRDSGPGIATGQGHLLFRKFAQLDNKPQQSHPTTTTATIQRRPSSVGQPAGTGLGLNLCLRFVQLMNGNIWVHNNEVGRGATFSFYIPIMEGPNLPDGMPRIASSHSLQELQQQQQHPNNMPDRSLAPLSEKTCNSGLRVLVVDDILINRKVLDRMLRKIGVHSVMVAESGEDALVILETNDFDLIISDLQMPGGMSGLELSETIRTMQFKSSRRRPMIVGLTADTSPDLYGRCMESGMVDVIHKPITVGDLHETLVRWRD